jgi:circadian clock protein KaiC
MKSTPRLAKLTTGVPGLDQILRGGIPRFSVNIIGGPPGSGKTILAQQIIHHNATEKNGAPYLVTVSEPTLKMLRYQQRFSYFDPSRIKDGTIVYFDIAEALRQGGLDHLLATITEYIETQFPTILAIDSFKAIHDLTATPQEIRNFAYNLALTLAAAECTSFLVGEYTEEDIARESIFAIADGIIILESERRGRQERRCIRVVKMRGDGYFRGRHLFTISDDGIAVYPRVSSPALPAHHAANRNRVSCGIPGLDDMLGSGLPVGSVTLLGGGAGTGKTLISLHFLCNGIAQGEAGVFVTFQEAPSYLQAIALDFGWDLAEMERQGMLKILHTSPVEMRVDEHALAIQAAIAGVDARRVVLDGLGNVELATPDKVRYKDYVHSLADFFRSRDITAFLTNEITSLFGSFEVGEHGIAFVSDNLVLLRYVEMQSRMSRAINVLKMRGSQHSKEIREFDISHHGIRIGRPIEADTGVLTGTPVSSDQAAWRDLAPLERYVLATLRPSDALSLEQAAAATTILPDVLLPILQDLAERGYLLIRGPAEHPEYRVKL